MQDDRPVLEIVIGDDGQPVFQICGLGMCTRHRQFAECQTLWEALLVAKGLHPDQHPVVMPAAEPSADGIRPEHSPSAGRVGG